MLIRLGINIFPALSYQIILINELIIFVTEI